MIVGVMVQDMTKKQSITEVIETAIAGHLRKFGVPAEIVAIHPCHANVEVEGIEIRRIRTIFPSCALAGRDEAE